MDRPGSRRTRGLAAVGGVLLLSLAVRWFLIGVSEGFKDGSFALVAYVVAGGFAAGAFFCFRVALARR